jgi:hypothetical protein
MSNRVLILVVLLAGCGSREPVGEDSSQETIKFVSSDQKFEINFPVAPHEESTPANALIGKLEGKVYEAEQSDVYYAVFYTRFGARRTNPQAELDTGRDNAVLAMQAKLLSDKNLQVEGYPGKEILLEHQDGTVQRIRVFLTDFELFQLMVGGPQGHKTTTATDAFFASFRLLPRENEANP